MFFSFVLCVNTTGLEEGEGISNDLFVIVVINCYFSKHARENHKIIAGQTDLKLENPVEASASGYITANTRHSKAAGRKTEEFQIRKFTTKYSRTMLVLVLSQLAIDAM